jgi:uncharacterized protein YdaU (DUF1376 family)
MNYYPFHIGDFAAHTAHLSFEEDIAYRRMLDWYYLNERALPLDAGKVARLIRMPKSLAAIQVVLDEFFVQSDDGWHNKRADEELTQMLAKQEQQAVKDEHESERIRRYRERRAAMFSALRLVGVVPAWDVAMKELQRLFDTHCNAPETHLQREQVVSADAPATAIPTPTPTPTPINKEKNAQRKRSARVSVPLASVDDLVQEGFAVETANEFIAHKAAVGAPLTHRAWQDHLAECKKAGWTPLQAAEKVMAKGWKGFEAKYVASETPPSGRAVQPLSFAQQDELSRRARWEEMTGRKWPATDAPADFIDVQDLQRIA